ncbi:MAG: choice-of-anchor D domain-containing protein, partial [Candidatus Tectomicrobia bacterium]|nr:choice-of-anchor D domain-containing protein [Candidatus Tectomicrobia bacterium]
MSIRIGVSFEKSSVEGTVFDQRKGKKLSGVQISLGDRQTTTDSQGHYQIDEIAPGDYTLSASLSGYHPFSLPLAIPPDSSLRRDLPLEPKAGSIEVTQVTSEDSGPNNFIYFLDGVDFDQTFTASVDWADHLPNYVRLQTPQGTFDEPDGIHTFNMGRDFGPGGRLTATAVSLDEEESEPRMADFVVMSRPPFMSSLLADLQAVKVGGGFYYNGKLGIGKFFGAGVGDDIIPSKIPLFGGKRFSFDWASLSLSSKVTSAGKADFGLSVGKLGVGLPELSFAGIKLSFKPSLKIEGKYRLDTLSWDWDGYIEISGEAGVQKSWPFFVMAGPVPVPLFVKASFKVTVAAQLGITGWSDTLPDLNGRLPVNPYFRGSVGAGASDILSASGFVGGGASMKLQWPNQPTLGELSLLINAGIEVYAITYQYEWQGLEWKWNLLEHKLPHGRAAREEFPDLRKPTPARPLPRDYLKRPGYGQFHRRPALRPEVHPSALPGVSQTPLQSLVFPYSEPSVSSRGSTVEQTITVSNAGLADLTLGKLSAPTAPFGIVMDGCSQATLIPGAGCTLTVSFAPTAEGTVAGSLELPSNDEDENPALVSLTGAGLLASPTALLSLNQPSFRPGDPLRLEAHVLIPTAIPPAGDYRFEAKLWLKTPLPFPSDLISIVNVAGPGQALSFSPGADQTVKILNITVPADLPAGAYEFGLRLRHPTTGEELSVSRVPLEVVSTMASQGERPRLKAVSRMAAAA